MLKQLRIIRNKLDLVRRFDGDYEKIIRSEAARTRDFCRFFIVQEYHVIEKGLTMPDRRLGFGHDVMLRLTADLTDYCDRFGAGDEQIRIALGVVKEYDDLHKAQSHPLEPVLQYAIDTLLARFPDTTYAPQGTCSRDEFFSASESPFPVFAASRHSLRNFAGEVDIETLRKAVRLAQNAPSACNRQSVRVKIVKTRDKVERVLGIQKGNRGFGHLADKLLVLTTDMAAWNLSSSRGGYIDGGIYAMNLLYALHYYRVAACPLNAYFSADQEKAFREIVPIPRSESVVLIIAVGKAPERFRLANSHRSQAESVITEY